MTTQNKAVVQTKALVPQAEKAVVSWQGRKITVTFDDVKNRICPKASDQEVVVFLRICQSLNLNPWAREIFMVKYGDEPASYIVAEESYLKGAETCREYDGYEAGIIVKTATGTLDFRPGAFFLEEETSNLAGGWAKVYRKDRTKPFYIAVNLKECQKYTKEGRVTKFWASMPATMIRKVALSRALREAFPTRLGGVVTEAESEEIPEGVLPPALEKDGQANWPKFYAKIRSELGLTPEEAHQVMKVESFNALRASGWTQEKIWDELILAIRRQKTIEVKPEQVVDVETGEIITQGEDLFGEDNAGAAAPEGPEEESTGAAAPAKSKRDPESIKTLNDLMKACFQDFKMQPNAVARELGHKSQSEITEKPAECYRTIAATRC